MVLLEVGWLKTLEDGYPEIIHYKLKIQLLNYPVLYSKSAVSDLYSLPRSRSNNASNNGRLIGNRQKIDRNSKNNPKLLEFLLSVIPVPERSSFQRFFGA